MSTGRRTVVAASLSRDVLGRFPHSDTMASDEFRAFNTTKNRVTVKPVMSVGDATGSAVKSPQQ